MYRFMITLRAVSMIVFVLVSAWLAGEIVVHVPWAMVAEGILISSFLRWKQKKDDWMFFFGLGMFIIGHEYEACQVVNAPFLPYLYGSATVATVCHFWLMTNPQKPQLPPMELQQEVLVLEDQG